MSGLWLGSWIRYWMGQRLAPFVPTPEHVGRQMLALARVRKEDRVYDLGCGDGGLLIQAATERGARGYGVELNKDLVAAAHEMIGSAGVSHLVTVELKDAKAVPLHDATVVLMYLSESGNAALLPKLASELAPSARVVSFCWSFPKHVSPTKVQSVHGIPLYLYSVDALRTEP